VEWLHFIPELAKAGSGIHDDDRVTQSCLTSIPLEARQRGALSFRTTFTQFGDFKPIYAVANDMALSAAYAIASAAQRVYVTRTGTVGSVGVYALHVEQSGFDKQTGIKYNYIHHGAKKVDANPHEPLSEGAEADIQAEVNRQGSIFVETVARNRRCSSAKVQATGLGCFGPMAPYPFSRMKWVRLMTP